MVSSEDSLSKLQRSPESVVPKRAFILAIAISIAGAVILTALNWDPIRLLGAFWIGVIAAQVNFRLIVINTHRQVNAQNSASKFSRIRGYGLRQLIAAAAIAGSAFMGLPAMFAAFIGLSIIKFAINLDNFVTFKAMK